MKPSLRKSITIMLGALAVCATSSCSLLGSILNSLDDITNASNGVSRDSSGQGWEERDSLLPVRLAELGATNGTSYLPSSGDVKVLVLPIQFTDKPFASSFMTDLNTVLNAPRKEDTGYWESVASFYEKTSFGKVHLNFEIAPIYQSSYTQEGAYSHFTADGNDNGTGLIKLAWEQYFASKSSTDPDYIHDNFDTDHDGWIDGIVAVYSGEDNAKGNLTYDRMQYYWAYTYWAAHADSQANGSMTWTSPSDKNNPKPNLYFWLSYDFMYNKNVTSPRVDAHTLIHETGHMFGLDDYYPEESPGFNAAGGWDMMDQNILDHNVFSKMVLGWTKPTVITDSGSISINPAESSGDCLLFPSASWNGTVYDEYMLVEFYTPTDLNYHDSHETYPGRYRGYSIPGIKIYHIDARLVTYNKRGTLTYTYFRDVSSLHGLSYASDHGYLIGATNCQKKASRADVNYSLLHLMESNGTNTFQENGLGSNDTLFVASTGRDTFSMSKFGSKFFPKRASFNNGDDFNFTIKVETIASNYANISFTQAPSV